MKDGGRESETEGTHHTSVDLSKPQSAAAKPAARQEAP